MDTNSEKTQFRVSVDLEPGDDLPAGVIPFAAAPPPAQFAILADEGKMKTLPTATQLRLLRASLLTLAGLFSAFDQTVAGVFEQLSQRGLVQKATQSGIIIPGGGDAKT